MHLNKSILFLFLILGGISWSQESNQRVKKIAAGVKKIKMDSLTVYPNSLEVFCGAKRLNRTVYFLNHQSNMLEILEDCGDTLVVRFRVLPMNLNKAYQHRDSSILYTEEKGDREKFLIQSSDPYQDIFGGSGIQKNGSISRGISFGNSQDLSVNSTLNLELSGDIAPNLKLLASVSDDNIPIQPEGNTNKLQEFDQVFVQIYNDQMKLIAGDFWLKKPQGYFLNYRKRAQGLYGEYSWKNKNANDWHIQGSGALSKGKFARQIIAGVEGNQGPYRLVGNEQEPFIIILSGTEKVYIDGRLLERGQAYDYVINYNSSEVIFTAKNLITKDVRIVVEFQYSDQNYARSLFQAGTDFHSKKLDFWLNSYAEQDAKNQTIQQELSSSQKLLLRKIGDSLSLAQTTSIDSTGYFDNQNMYKMIDSLGIDSVLVFSVNPDSALYRASFAFVGLNKGNYRLASPTALGKVFQWVAPIAGVPQGSYEPARQVITPKQKQMVSSGVRYRIKKGLVVETELAYSKNDLNTFSREDAQDDEAYSNYTSITSSLPLNKQDTTMRWKWNNKMELEALSSHFSPIEQYRSVEFDRDWNTRGKNFEGNQLSLKARSSLANSKHGEFGLEFAKYTIGSDYAGYKSGVFGKWRQKGFFADWNGTYLNSQASGKNEFLRHKVKLTQKLGRIKLGFQDDFERNLFRNDSLLLGTSYLFYDHEYYISQADSSKFNYKVYYRERIDQRSDSARLQGAAKSRNGGVDLALNPSVNQRINFVLNYRELTIENDKLISQKPENTLLGRIEYDQKAWNGALSWNTFYEVGSGLELKREFLYLQVNDGQGVYTWIDYNGDGVKDLNEFEIAQYVDQANFIRVFTPSSEYVKTFSSEFNQGIFIKPERVWSNKTGILKALTYVSNQSRIRINRKTSDFDTKAIFNPFQGELRDTSLLSSGRTIRNTLYFNRTSSIFAADYTYQEYQSKVLLATGFDAREQLYNELNFRLNIKKKYSLETSIQKGYKLVQADYTTGRNFNIAYILIKPSFIYQPSSAFRVSLDTRYQEKRNVAGESAFVSEYGFQMKYNQVKRGSFQTSMALIAITYNGGLNSALGFEMLESLQPGNNIKWDASYQRSISKNLQISLQYNGRKSINNKAIHSGGMEVRAFF